MPVTGLDVELEIFAKDSEVWTGKMLVKYSDSDNLETASEKILNKGDNFHVYTGLRHQMIALEDTELFDEIQSHDIDLIRLITPTTNPKRLKKIIQHASGFLYYVTVTGITGQKSANMKELKFSIEEIRRQSIHPVVAGFGIKIKNQVAEICKITDGAVVGSSIVKIIENNLNQSDVILKLIGNFII